MLECVPNFSEGRDAALLQKIVDAIQSAPGVLLLGSELDSDHNRSVVTFAGAPDAVVEGVIRGVAKASELIDLSHHRGQHPRVGAADVVPFIPLATSTLGTSTMNDAIAAAHNAGREIWQRLEIPVYFYEYAARSPHRKRLEKVRRNGFDGGPPDVGSIASHLTAGAVMCGARRILIAYNVDLASPDVAIAKTIARRVRESSGGFPHVKAMGLYLESRGCAQVSMNLVDYERTDLDALYATIESEAAKLGASVRAGEIIGFIPQAAYDASPSFFQKAFNFSESRIIETRLAQLLHSKQTAP